MSRFEEQVGRLLAVGLLVAGGSLAVASCSSGQSTVTGAQTCGTVPNEKWSSVPAGIDSRVIAEVLRVPLKEVEEGSYGDAVCPVGFTAQEVDGSAIADVTREGSNCLGITTFGIDQAPRSYGTFHELVFVCPRS